MTLCAICACRRTARRWMAVSRCRAIGPIRCATRTKVCRTSALSHSAPKYGAWAWTVASRCLEMRRRADIEDPAMLIFDAHLDLAWNALDWNRNLQLPC